MSSLKTRTNGFTSWVNIRLSQPGHLLLENTLNEPLNANNIVHLLKSFTGAPNKKLGNLDRLTSAQKQNQVQNLIRELKKNGVIPEDVFFDSHQFILRNADHVFDLLWCLVCHDIWYVWKQGSTILRKESEELLLVAPFHIFEEVSKITCWENLNDRIERNSVCLPSPESCILDMVNTQLKMTSEGCRLNCRNLSDLSNSHNLCALLNAFVPDIFPFEVLINDRWTTDLVLRTIEDLSEIRSPFNTEDLIEGDTTSICAYFCFFFIVACRYRQCRAVIQELAHIKRAIGTLECLIENTVESTKEKTAQKKYVHLENIKNHTRNRKILDERFNPHTFDDWIQRVETIKKKVRNIIRQKMEEKFETITISRETTIAKLNEATGINLSITTGYGYYLCQAPDIVSESRDIILREKQSGKFISENQKNKRNIRTTVGLWSSSASILQPSMYPEYEIYLEITSKNRQLSKGVTFLYQVFPSCDTSWKQQFLKAAKQKDFNAVLRMAKFFKEDPDFINLKESQSGNTALHYATQYGKAGIVQCLLECHADFDCQNKNLSTPLHFAVVGRHRAIIHMLIEWGCDVSMKDDKQQTAMERISSSKLKQFMTETYSHYLSAMPAIMNGDSDLLLKLIKDHINRRNPFCSLGSRCVSGSTLLHTAVYWCDTESVDSLLRLGVDPDIRDYKGATPLHRSRDNTSSAILLEAGADIDAADNDGNTPLHIKCYEKNDETSDLELLTFLVERKADIIKRNNRGVLPIHCSAMQGRIDIIDYLIKADTDGLIAYALTEKHGLPSLMFLALNSGFLSCAHWLLDKKFRLLEGEPEKLLFEIVCKLIKTSNPEGILKFVFEYGVDANFRFQNNNTALHYVCSFGCSEFTLKTLLEHGASLNALNNESMSPLAVAVKANNLKSAAVLLQAGADMMKENDYGHRALDFVRDPDEWISSKHLSEEIKEVIIAHCWQEAKHFIQNLTAKVRSERLNTQTSLLPKTTGSTIYNYNHWANVSSVQRLPNIFITSGDSMSFPETVLKPKKDSERRILGRNIQSF